MICYWLVDESALVLCDGQQKSCLESFAKVIDMNVSCSYGADKKATIVVLERKHPAP